MTSPLFDTGSIRNIMRSAVGAFIVCAILFSLYALNFTNTGLKYFCLMLSTAGAVALAALLIGGLAGAVLALRPSGEASANKRGLETIAASVPSFLIGIGTAGVAKAGSLLVDQAASFAKDGGYNTSATQLFLISVIAFWFIFGLFIGVSYQTEAPSAVVPPQPQL